MRRWRSGSIVGLRAIFLDAIFPIVRPFIPVSRFPVSIVVGVHLVGVVGVAIAPKEETDAQGRQTYPRLHVTHHPGHGTVVLLLRWDAPDLFVSAAPRPGQPEVYVFIPPNVHERWPSELFVSPTLAREAIEHALEHGQPHPALHWIANGDFLRGEAEQR